MKQKVRRGMIYRYTTVLSDTDFLNVKHFKFWIENLLTTSVPPIKNKYRNTEEDFDIKNARGRSWI